MHMFVKRSISFLALWVMVSLGAAAQTGTSSSKPGTTQPTQSKPSETPPPAAGGPQGDIGPIAVPKKNPEESKPVEKPAKVKNPEGLEDFSMRVNVPLVNLDVSVLTK